MQTCEEIVIQLKSICFSYPGRPPVLNGLDFELRRGERVGLVGANGAGKTTLFHLIMGLFSPASGSIRIFGRERVKESDFREVRRRIGFLFQNPDDQLFCPTVLEDVAFGPMNLGASPATARQTAMETLEMLGIPDFAPRISHRLSHGEKKLAAMACILAMGPELLILDEPSSGLDRAAKEKLVEVLERLDLTCVVASHEMDFLDRITTVVYGMSDGRIDTSARPAVHSHTHLHPGGGYQHSHDDLL
ncbi:MAG: ABC transporter ATP-binding protein [Desulfomonilia bacterium]|jgi:cobalt/nickel transport system ATP-binding protein